MKKVIVFKVENVLVGGFDEKRNDELNAKRVVRKLVGDDFFEKEFVKGEKKMVKEKDGDLVEKVVRKVAGFGVMKKRLEDCERKFEEEGDVEKLYWMRDVLRKLKEWEGRTPPPANVEYIRKEFLLEWAKEEQAKCSSETHPYAMFMNVVIDKLNSV